MRHLGIQCSLSFCSSSTTLAQATFDAVVRQLALEGTFRVMGRTSPGRLEVLIVPHLGTPLSRQLLASVAEQIASAAGPLVPQGVQSAALSPCVDRAGFASRDCYTLVPALKARLSPIVAETGDGEWPAIMARLDNGESLPDMMVAETQPRGPNKPCAGTGASRAAAE